MMLFFSSAAACFHITKTLLKPAGIFVRLLVTAVKICYNNKQLGANGFDGDNEAVGCIPRILRRLVKKTEKTIIANNELALAA